MARAVFIDLGKALRHPRRVFLVARIAPRTRRARGAAWAAVIAIPRPAWMFLHTQLQSSHREHFAVTVWIRGINKTHGVVWPFLTSNPSGIACARKPRCNAGP
jgi:hypothetical protein